MDIYTLDFETFWDSKSYTLSKTGPIEYVRDPRFAAQMVAVAKNMDPPVVAASRDAIQSALGDIDWNKDCVVGHNMSGFDALILSEAFGKRPRNIWDTICMMRWCGLSSVSRERLASLAELLGIGEKKAGTVVSDGKSWPSDFSFEERAFFTRYCADDAAMCREAARLMLPHMTGDGMRFMSLTARMATEPVFELDEATLEEYARQLDEEADAARRNIMSLFHFETVADFLKALRSKEKFASMLRELGVEPPMKLSEKKSASAGADVYDYAFSKQDIPFLDLREHEDARVRTLVEARLEFNSSVLRSRCETLLKFARQKKPLPILLSAFRAHTSRYAASANGDHKSDAINPQNLSKRNPAHLALRKSIKAPAGYKIVACDSSQIEARVNAWFCRENDLVEQFREGRDPYAELAEKFGHGPSAKEIHDGAKSGDKRLKALRNAGKVGILSAGYGVGSVKYADTLWRGGIKLADNYASHCEQAFRAHAVYRASNPNIVFMWKTCQKVIEALAVGGSGKFGGPNDDLMEYGILPIAGREDLAVPTIKSPSGYHLRYPGLRWQDGEFVYDSFLGKNKIAKRLYGGLLLENCIAEGTLVYTDSGWKPIETITLSDKVYDGVDFVSHSGLAYKGERECIFLDGVALTPDHKVLTLGGWRDAKEADVSRLARPELRGAPCDGVNPPQFQGCQWASVRGFVGGKAAVFHRENLGLALSLPMRRIFIPQSEGSYKVCFEGVSSAVRAMRQGGDEGVAFDARHESASVILGMAEHDSALSFANAFCVEKIRRARNFCVRALENFSEFLRGCSRQIRSRLGFGQDRQQSRVFAGQLPLDILQREQQKSSGRICGYRRGGIGGGVWDKQVNDILPDTSRMAAGAADDSPVHRQYKVAGVQSEARVSKKVFDIKNCGPRHRFVVSGAAGPFIVHNCIQSLAFQILMWQACRMDEAGISLKCNIHDSWATVVPEGEAYATAGKMVRHMRRAPSWAEGCPLDAEAEIGDDFTIV